MSHRNSKRPIILTDDAWIMGEDPPISVKDLKEKMIDPLKNTPAALWWSIGDYEKYHIETNVGERVSDEGYSKDTNAAAILKNLVTESGGPLTSLVKLCKDAGIEFFPRVRMNSHYAYKVQYEGGYRNEHPDLLIGKPGEEIPEGTIDYGIRRGKNYTFKENRDYMYAVITELFERWDIDGVELDFCRHPAMFRREEAFQNRYLMTDLIKRVRARMNEVGKERNKKILLAVRVGQTLNRSMEIGLDVRKWMKDGIVDIVTAGIGWMPFSLRLPEFVEAAKGTNCQIYGCIEGLRPHVDDTLLRGTATKFWNQGASGIHLYNYFTMHPQWWDRMLNELSDPKNLTGLNTCYEIEDSGRYTYTGHGDAFQNASVPEQLPATLRETLTDRGAIFEIEISDDIETAVKSKTLETCVLEFQMDNYAPTHALSVKVNDKSLNWQSVWTNNASVEWGPMSGKRNVYFNITSPPLKNGLNIIEVKLIEPKPYNYILRERKDEEDRAPLIRKIHVHVLYKH